MIRVEIGISYLYRRSTKESVPLTGDSGDNWMPNRPRELRCPGTMDDNRQDRDRSLRHHQRREDHHRLRDAKTTIPWVDTTEFRPALSDGYVAWVESGGRKRQVLRDRDRHDWVCLPKQRNPVLALAPREYDRLGGLPKRGVPIST